MVEEGEIKLVQTPIWYLQIRSKIILRRDRQFLAILIPLAASYIIAAQAFEFLFRYYPNDLTLYFSIGLFFIVFGGIYFLVWKFLITWNAKYDKFDLFAYRCGSVGLELSRVAVVPEYNDYLGAETQVLKRVTRSLKRKYKGPNDKATRESLTEFLKNINRIEQLLKKPDSHKKELSELSGKFLDLGMHVITNHQHTRLDPPFINRITESLQNIPKTGFTAKAIYEYAKRFAKSRSIIVLALSVIFALLTYYISLNYYQVSKEWAISYGLGVLVAIPTLVRELNLLQL